MSIGQYEIARRSGGARAIDARQANDRIAEKAERLRCVSRVPMMCECSDRDCRAVVMIRLEDYHATRRDGDAVLTARGHAAAYEAVRSDSRQFIVAPGHDLPEIEKVVAQERGYQVVRKQGEAAEYVADRDPRN